MPRKDASPAPVSRRRGRAILAFGIGISLIAGIAVLGTFAAATVGSRNRYRLPLTAIEFTPPAWVDRETFLTEVRYLGDLPDTFNPNTRAEVERLRAAFARHPWVEFVGDDGYATIAKTYPLTVGFRRPVLVVTTTAGPPRTVDAQGVLLPIHEPIMSLTRLVGPIETPTIPPGSTWDHPTVRRAAELAERYDAESIERTAAGWRIVRRNGPALVLER